MPTYQYACTDAECGERFELVQSFTDPAASECPICHSGVRKVYGSVGVVFKGSGFYRTDSRSASKSTELAASSTSAASSGGESKGETKSEPKTSTKSESASKTPAAASA
jgi:putative FmdB family regulatory protein